MVCVFLFFSNSIRTAYKKSSSISFEIEKKYNENLKKYEKTANFLLKNSLPQTLEYFNSVNSAAYSLYPVEKIEITTLREKTSPKKEKAVKRDDLLIVVGCYEGRCIKAFVDRGFILTELSNSILWNYGKIKEIPIKKIDLLKISIKSFWEPNKVFIITILIFFLIFYLVQTIVLLIINFKQFKAYSDLLEKFDERSLDLLNKSRSFDRLYKDSVYIYDVVDNYFSHYAHNLVSEDAYIEAINIPELLQKIAAFLSYKIVKQELEIVFSTDSTVDVINTDSEVLFVILLNLIFKSVSRAKISSKIGVRLFQNQEVINIEVLDTGYEYNEKMVDGIKIYMLPKLMLESLCRKIGIVNIEERKNGGSNSTLIQIISSELKSNIEE